MSQTFNVESESGNTYTVTKSGDQLTCDCKDFLYRGRFKDPPQCKHTEEVRKEKQ